MTNILFWQNNIDFNEYEMDIFGGIMGKSQRHLVEKLTDMMWAVNSPLTIDETCIWDR